MSITIGIIGCGNIGSAIADHASEKLSGAIDKIILFDTDNKKLDAAAGVKSLVTRQAVKNLESVFEYADLVIEAVSPGVAKEVLEIGVSRGTDVMIMSIGGVLSNEHLLEIARNKNVKVLLPSGAIAGIDAIKAAKIGGIDEVTITTRKPPKSLNGIKFLEDKGFDIEAITEETVIFEGNAELAIKHFPKNINVSAILSLAGTGSEKTKVKIISSPEFTSNSHEIIVKGASGTIISRTDNMPSPSNPKTSYLASLSAISALESYLDPVKIGA